MSDVFFRVTRAPGQRGFMWRRVRPYVAALLEDECPVSLERTVVLASPHTPEQVHKRSTIHTTVGGGGLDSPI